MGKEKKLERGISTEMVGDAESQRHQRDAEAEMVLTTTIRGQRGQDTVTENVVMLIDKGPFSLVTTP